MSDEDFRCLTQDFCWNAHDSRFVLPLHSDVFYANAIEVKHELDGDARLAIFQGPELSAVVYCTYKEGIPSKQFTARFESATSLYIDWPGVTRIFARVRIIESTENANMVAILHDDIEGGHSDVEDPHLDQSRNPWSDQEDSETDTWSRNQDSKTATTLPPRWGPKQTCPAVIRLVCFCHAYQWHNHPVIFSMLC